MSDTANTKWLGYRKPRGCRQTGCVDGSKEAPGTVKQLRCTWAICYAVVLDILCTARQRREVGTFFAFPLRFFFFPCTKVFDLGSVFVLAQIIFQITPWVRKQWMVGIMCTSRMLCSRTHYFASTTLAVHWALFSTTSFMVQVNYTLSMCCFLSYHTR